MMLFSNRKYKNDNVNFYINIEYNRNHQKIKLIITTCKHKSLEIFIKIFTICTLNDKKCIQIK